MVEMVETESHRERQRSETGAQKVNKPKQKRPAFYQRKFLVDPGAQFRVVSFLAGIAIVAASVVCIIAYFRLVSLESIFNQRIIPPAVMPQVFQEMARKLMIQLIIIVSFMIIVFALAGVILTHRLAGPIWKLQRDIKRFLDGDTTAYPINFRKSDEFQELPTLVNKLIEGYKRD